MASPSDRRLLVGTRGVGGTERKLQARVVGRGRRRRRETKLLASFATARREGRREGWVDQSSLPRVRWPLRLIAITSHIITAMLPSTPTIPSRLTS